jgi:hypothetical protein
MPETPEVLAGVTGPSRAKPVQRYAAQRILSAEMNPTAECIGTNGTEPDGCGWVSSMWGDARSEGKDHAKRTGHKVLVIRETRDVYHAQDKS